MKLFVEPFKADSEDATFRKIYEELYELTEARAYATMMGDVREHNVIMECGDLLTAIVNWCVWAGIEPQECLDYANTKNVLRGRYDTM